MRVEHSKWGDEQGHKGIQGINVEVLLKVSPSTQCRLQCKLHKLLLADENNSFVIETGNCNYQSSHENDFFSLSLL